MKNTVFILLLLLLSIDLYADDFSTTKIIDHDKLRLDFGIGEGGTFSPNIFIPFSWSDQLSSGVGFQQSSDIHVGNLEEFDGRTTTQNRKNTISLDALTFRKQYELWSYYIGAGVSAIRLNRNGFGYFEFPLPIDDIVVFENRGKITTVSPKIDFTLAGHGGRSSLTLNCSFQPLSWLWYDQNTEFKPIIDEPGIHSSSTTTGFAFNADLAPSYLFANILWLSGYFATSYLPLNYSTKILNYSPSDNSFGFKEEAIETTEWQHQIEVNIGLERINISGVIPTVGIGWNTHKSTLSGEKSSESSSTPYFAFGLNLL